MLPDGRSISGDSEVSPERVRVLVRADATAALGIGHVARCLTLARQLQIRGATVSFAGAAMPESLAAGVRLAGFEVRTLASNASPVRSQQDDATCVIELLGELGGADVVIVDHYDLDADWERAVAASGSRVAVIDDLADRPHDCALLLDQNLYDDSDARYLGLVPEGCRLLLGPRWALLRDEFVTAAKSPRPRTGDISRILISYGGADPTHETEKALAALADVPSIETIDVVVGAAFADVWRVRAAVAQDSRCTIHEQPGDMAGLMSDADLALGAGGSTTWERCAARSAGDRHLCGEQSGSRRSHTREPWRDTVCGGCGRRRLDGPAGCGSHACGRSSARAADGCRRTIRHRRGLRRGGRRSGGDSGGSEWQLVNTTA